MRRCSYTVVLANGKAMIGCMSRRICYELYEAIRKLRPDCNHIRKYQNRAIETTAVIE
jgi:hypothetical protein